MNKKISHKVLLVEDNLGDVVLMEEAIAQKKLNIHLDHCEDGGAALEYLKKIETNQLEEPPKLIILDLNLPKVSGKEVLKKFKTSEVAKAIPIIIFSTSSLDSDISDCYLNGANAFLTKPSDVFEFFDLMELTCAFWFKQVHLYQAIKTII